MKRRNFLKKTAVGSASLASLTSVVNSLAAPPSAAGITNFRFMALSFAATIGGVAHTMLMNGDGKISPSQVVGGGSFLHFDRNSAVPQTILASGTWKAKQLISFNRIGTYGSVAAGIAEMWIHLVVDLPSPAVIPAMLEVVCNVGFAGLNTGEEEGFILTIPGASFGPFVPSVPPTGLTILTTGNEQRD
jgi:hypothetical protein